MSANLEVFPDGKRLLFTIEVYPDARPGKEIEETARRDAEKEKSKVKAKMYESLLFRRWDTWEDGKRSHVFVWEIGSRGAARSDARVRCRRADQTVRRDRGARHLTRRRRGRLCRDR